VFVHKTLVSSRQTAQTFYKTDIHQLIIYARSHWRRWLDCQGSYASWKVLELFFKISSTWKVLKNEFGPGKSWKLKLKVLESP